MNEQVETVDVNGQTLNFQTAKRNRCKESSLTADAIYEAETMNEAEVRLETFMHQWKRIEPKAVEISQMRRVI